MRGYELEHVERIELSTNCLEGRDSTTELHMQKQKGDLIKDRPRFGHRNAGLCFWQFHLTCFQHEKLIQRTIQIYFSES